MKNRLRKCVAKLRANNLDAIIISNPLNVSYLSGFREAAGYLLLTSAQELVYFTNFIYEYEAKALDIWKVISVSRNIFRELSGIIKKLRLHNIAIEAKNISFPEFTRLRQYFVNSQVKLHETMDFVEKIRAIKETKEIISIRKAIEISKEAFDFATQIYDITITEKELGIELEKFLRISGSNSVAFTPIVASGANSAFPHHQPRRSKMLSENFFLIDLGAKHCEYCADLTRVFTWGKISPFFKKVYDIVKKAQDLSIRKIKDGVRAKDVDFAARSFIERKGYAKYFGHGTGHGVGLAVHEAPFVNQRSEEILKEGMIVAIEPAIYINGKFGIRIEDMVLVCKNKGEVLSGDFYREHTPAYGYSLR